MATGKQLSLGVAAIALVAIAIRVGLIYRERHEDVKPVVADSGPMDPDINVYVKHEHPASLKDEKDLKGRKLWVCAGGQLIFYPYKSGHVDYTHPAGTLLGAEPILIDDAVEAVAPKAATYRIPGGDRHVLLAFTRPGSAAQFAVPVGYRQNGTYTLYTDEVFYYEDPHQLYSFWGPEIWKAIDEHRAIPGMTEHEVEIALGQVSTSSGKELGDRTVRFDNLGHPIDVTFVHNKATTIQPE